MEKIELHVHEAHVLTLRSLGSAGYRWSATVDDPQLVKVERVGTVRGHEEFSLIGFAPRQDDRAFRPGALVRAGAAAAVQP